MIMVPRHYEADLLALAQSNAKEGGDGNVNAALQCALAHGLNPDEQTRALSACVVALSTDSFARRPESAWFAHFRTEHPLAWIVYLPDSWNADGAASLWWSDDEYFLQQKRALACASVSASNQNGPITAEGYPLVLPHYCEREVLNLAARWGVSPTAALHAVLEIGLAGFRKHATHGAERA